MAKNIQPTPQAEKDLRAAQAQALQDNPLWNQALNELEESYTKEWKLTEGPHQEYRERAYHMVKAITKLRAQINEYAISGNLNRQSVRNAVQKDK